MMLWEKSQRAYSLAQMTSRSVPRSRRNIAILPPGIRNRRRLTILRHRGDGPTTSVNRPQLSDRGDAASADRPSGALFGRNTTEENPRRELCRTPAHHRPPYCNCHLHAYMADWDVVQTRNGPG